MSEDELQNLQDAAQSLFSSFGGEEAQDYHQSQSQRQSGFGGGDFNAMFTPELLGKLSQIMQRMNGRDPRTDLILALKPLLSRRRQHRAEQAAQMIKMMELMPTLQEAMR